MLDSAIVPQAFSGRGQAEDAAAVHDPPMTRSTRSRKSCYPVPVVLMTSLVESSWEALSPSCHDPAFGLQAKLSAVPAGTHPK